MCVQTKREHTGQTAKYSQAANMEWENVTWRPHFNIDSCFYSYFFALKCWHLWKILNCQLYLSREKHIPITTQLLYCSTFFIAALTVTWYFTKSAQPWQRFIARQPFKHQSEQIHSICGQQGFSAGMKVEIKLPLADLNEWLLGEVHMWHPLMEMLSRGGWRRRRVRKWIDGRK